MLKAAAPPPSPLGRALTRPAFQRAVLLGFGAILALWQRTVTTMLRIVRPLATGHWSDLHRLLCALYRPEALHQKKGRRQKTPRP